MRTKEVAQHPLQVLRLRIPDGRPLIPLKGKVTDQTIIRWAVQTRAAWLKKGYFLINDGLIYTLKTFFIDGDKYPAALEKAARLIRRLPNE